MPRVVTESAGGVPELGLVSFRGSKKNNIILSGEICHAFVPFKDANPDCPSQHRYKAIVAIYKPTRGLHVYSSPDGIHWKPMSDKAVITTGYFDSQNLALLGHRATSVCRVPSGAAWGTGDDQTTQPRGINQGRDDGHLDGLPEMVRNPGG